MEKVINSASNSDVCFQFWELFLNSGLRRVRKNETLQSSHDRLLLGYHTHIGKGSKLEITPTSTRILKEEMKSHIKSYNDVMADIKELSGLCFDYQMAFGKVEYISHKYESFRFLVINTFINYFIDDAAYGFRLNGVSKFFDELIEGNEYLRRSTLRILTEGSNVRAISKEMRNILKIEYIDTSAMIVDDYYTQNSKNEVIVSDENSDKHRVVQFLRSVTANADKFTGLVIARFDMMSLSCMRIFFNDSINVYLPWMPAGSSGKPGSKAHSAKVFPAKKLSEKAGMIYHEINWRSYASYNRIAANRSPLSDGEKGANARTDGDSLGVMARWPIRQGITHDGHHSDGIFEIGGFIRTMRRYSKVKCAIFEPDDYTDEVWGMDKLVVERLVGIFAEQIGKRLSLKY